MIWAQRIERSTLKASLASTCVILEVFWSIVSVLYTVRTLIKWKRARNSHEVVTRSPSTVIAREIYAGDEVFGGLLVPRFKRSKLILQKLEHSLVKCTTSNVQHQINGLSSRFSRLSTCVSPARHCSTIPHPTKTILVKVYFDIPSIQLGDTHGLRGTKWFKFLLFASCECHIPAKACIDDEIQISSARL